MVAGPGQLPSPEVILTRLGKKGGGREIHEFD